jgi:hypothetical protein
MTGKGEVMRKVHVNVKANLIVNIEDDTRSILSILDDMNYSFNLNGVRGAEVVYEEIIDYEITKVEEK